MNEAAFGNREVDAKQALIQKSLEDESFRGRLLADPKVTIEREFGSKLPEDLEVRVVEETRDTVYLVLPPSKAPGELSEVDLDAVAGGRMVDKIL